MAFQRVRGVHVHVHIMRTLKGESETQITGNIWDCNRIQILIEFIDIHTNFI